MASRTPQVNRLTAAQAKRLTDRHAKLRAEFSDAYADVETNEDADATSKLEAKRDKVGQRLHEVADKLRAAGFALEHDDSQPEPPAEPEPKPAVPLAQVKKSDTVHVYRKGKKGYLVAEGCSVKDGDLALKCRWHKEAITIPLKDVTRLTVLRDKQYVQVAL